MTLTRWLLVIGIFLAVGMAKVSEQTALLKRSYALAVHSSALSTLENQTRWLNREVAALESPLRLAKTMDSHRMNLVGRSRIASTKHAGWLARLGGGE